MPDVLGTRLQTADGRGRRWRHLRFALAADVAAGFVAGLATGFFVDALVRGAALAAGGGTALWLALGADGFETLSNWVERSAVSVLAVRGAHSAPPEGPTAIGVYGAGAPAGPPHAKSANEVTRAAWERKARIGGAMLALGGDEHNRFVTVDDATSGAARIDRVGERCREGCGPLPRLAIG